MYDLHYKTDASILFRRGYFGNAIPSWPDPQSIPEAKRHEDRWALRSLWPQGPFQAGLTYPQLVDHWTEDFYIVQSLETNVRLLQGDLSLTTEGPALTYTLAGGTHRKAMLQGPFRYVTGIKTLALLQHYTSPASYTELQNCIEAWPEGIIELTVFDRDVGTNPGCNTIIWEVRQF